MNNGSMFGTLKNYTSQAYYNAHPTFQIMTPTSSYTILVIAGFRADTSSYVYAIPESTEQMALLYDEIIERSAFKSNVSFQEGDRLVTLSTCTDNREDAYRYVVVGKVIGN